MLNKTVEPGTETRGEGSLGGEPGHLESAARRLAVELRNTGRIPGKPSVTKYLSEYRKLFQEAIDRFRGASESELALSYAAEWMLDNDYLVFKALRQIMQDLPGNYYRDLPKLTRGPLEGYPRVYAIGREIIRLWKGSLDLEEISRFLDIYQSITPLTMGEIWALPIMLRLGIIQSLVHSGIRLTGLDDKSEKDLLPELDLKDSVTDEEIIAVSFISLRAIAAQDWKEFFENQSLVERILTADPAKYYNKMDFETRDRYRKVVEDISSGSGKSEADVAVETVRLAQAAMDRLYLNGQIEHLTRMELDVPVRQSHVGYYLIDKGREELENQTGYQPGLNEIFLRVLFRFPTSIYLGSILLLTAFWLALITYYASLHSNAFWNSFLVILLTVIPAITVSTQLVNWILSLILKPNVLPKMEFEEGIPDDHSAVVVMPTLISSEEEVDSLLEQIEHHYLRNPDENLSFALLTDLPDLDVEHIEDDTRVVEYARDGIRELNKKYSYLKRAPFLFFHRNRTWNPKENVWMGWERKRGKLKQLNLLILKWQNEPFIESTEAGLTSGVLPLENDENGFSVVEGNLEILRGLRYVITLDSDTILPPDSAQRLVETLAHPLNKAEFDKEGRIVSGYSILQPRTEITPVSAMLSIFTRVYSGDTGLDLYTLAVSDIYQDLFGEGIYVGKGIYDISTFEKSTKSCCPENALLSHDLFEGIHGRAALVTDTTFIEEYPSRFLVFARRMHRWIRGDWQLLPWLFPLVHSASGKWVRNRLSVISVWKILDNLRRSLLPPSLIFLIAAAWVGILPGGAEIWTVAAALVLATPLMIELYSKFFQASSKQFDKRFISGALSNISPIVLRWFFELIFLPFEAFLALDAILRTLARLFITRRNLLSWTTNAQTEKSFGSGNERLVTWKEMAPAVLSALVLLLLVLLFDSESLWITLPLLIAWTVSPEIAYRISLPFARKAEPISDDDVKTLHCVARRTWLFFEQYVGPEDHWLPPDHFQESPLGVAAHRTSPTNIGLYLTTVLGAYDFGYIDLLNLSTRMISSFDGLERLERYRGHFLNWYDTRTMESLQPRYVSTVDSGNLAAGLISLRQGLFSLIDNPILRWDTFQGFLDTLDLISDLFQNIEEDSLITEDARNIVSLIKDVRSQISEKKGNPDLWIKIVEQIDDSVYGRETFWQDLDNVLIDFVENYSTEVSLEFLRQIRLFANQLRRQLEASFREIRVLTPWLFSLNHLPVVLKNECFFDPLSGLMENLRAALPQDLSLGKIPEGVTTAQLYLDRIEEVLSELPCDEESLAEFTAWCSNLRQEFELGSSSAKALQIGFREIAAKAERYVREMDFDFLYNPDRKVFHIGYNLAIGKLDSNYYDLLASEARIASLIAIAKGDVPLEHWLHLARPLTKVYGKVALLSWSATMFEYLMPQIFFRSYEGTLLHHSSRSAVEIQEAYGSHRNVPWGISESGYYRFDQGMSYQYRAFGVPGLGYKRGLIDDIVIAPYASLLGLSIKPKAVIENIRRFNQHNAIGIYGLYEALDFTETRMPLGSSCELVKEYMAHHQAMIFLSMVNYRKDQVMVRRFHADELIQSVELLLQEQLPREAPLEQPHTQELRAIRPRQPRVIMTPWRVKVNSPRPRVHFLSNGKFGTLVMAAGGGYSTWRDTDLTRWRADGTLGNWGTWLYIQDLDTNELWSAGYQPTRETPDSRDTYFNAHMAAYSRRDRNISTTMEVVVAPDEDVEIRLLTLTNHQDQPSRLRITSYGEVILAPQNSDERHPAFNKLFIESEFVPEQNTLLFHRRPRSGKESIFYLAHALVLKFGEEPSLMFESDRSQFIGRAGSTRSPQELINDLGLSGRVGSTLDPIFSLGQEIVLEPHATTRLAFLLIAAKKRQEVFDTVNRFRVWPVIERAFERARAQAEIELLQLGLDTTQLPYIQNVLSGLLFPHTSMRASEETLAANHRGQSGLWAYSISGDYPILLARINSSDELTLIKDLLQAHAYWRNRSLKIDLVFLNEQGTTYGQELNNQIYRMLTRTGNDAWINRRGGIFILNADRLEKEDRILLESAARVVLDGKRGGLHQQYPASEALPPRLPAFNPSIPVGDEPEATDPIYRPADLLFDNHYGGFSRDGCEYQIYISRENPTPAPWSNVISNPDFGFLVTESGLGCTWAINSGENRLTPWSNDPVIDPQGEIIYLRDEETADVWTPTPRPSPDASPYLIRHGAGYTIFEHNSRGLRQRLRVFVDPVEPVKILHLRLENIWNRPRRITVTYYAEWVLGVQREDSKQFILPEYHGETQAILARNPYSAEFGERIAFAASDKKLHGLTGDRTEFIGRLGDRELPTALTRIGLAGTIQPGLDPCAALQVHLDLQPGESQDIAFFLGQGQDYEDAIRIVNKYKEPGQVERTWEDSGALWDRLLEKVHIKTPEPAMDLLLNRWMLYQDIACRYWGRTAFYQSSGAYGFRDQLQDVTAFITVNPHMAREHILRAARHQFQAGDVLHWWHPPSGRGIRTRFSDDLLWLPYVTAFYVKTTGDLQILNEEEPFVEGPSLEEDQEERYGYYPQTEQRYSLYEHCQRALEKGATRGRHNLPLMGVGDWNDGMNRVGVGGEGESVWLAWFLADTLSGFADLCEMRGELKQAEVYRQQAESYIEAVEKNAWDGDWYIRAFYDDGTPLGSSQNRECKIDSIAQSWGILSNGGSPERTFRAMEAVSEHLVRPEERMILLFTPPFNKTPRDPGYIKGYVPGIRENGGQYTHAAIWTVWAFAQMGRGDYAEELFQLLNPIYRTATKDKADIYKVEPYVIAADIYSVPPHTGRGGWTWYTGSAGWMYRLGIQAILGLYREGEALVIDPCIPREWQGYEIIYRHEDTEYQIQVKNPHGVNRGVSKIQVDGKIIADGRIPLENSGKQKKVVVLLGEGG